MNIRKHEHTEEVNAMLEENAGRCKEIFSKPDQRTGKGMEGHDACVKIKDYAIPTQWVYEEVAQNVLYREVAAAGSVKEYVKKYNAELEEGEASISAQDVEDALFVIRCQNDPAFVFAVCFVILYKETGEVKPFVLRYAQRKLLAELEDMRRKGLPIRLILLKARQWGGSTMVQLYMAWIQIFVRSGWNSVIVAQTEATAKRIKAMYSLVLEHFPAFIFDEEQLKFSPKERSNNDFVITNEHRTVVRNNVVTVSSYEKIDAEAGANMALAHFSEVALWNPTPSKTPESVIRVVDGGMLETALTLQVMESTARGRAGYFYDEYQEAKKGKSARRALFVPFYYIEFDSLPFASKLEKIRFCEWMIKNRNQQSTEDRTAEPGAYIWSLWKKGATLEHIKWYVQKRKSFHDHAHMASEVPSDDIECFMYAGNLIFSADLIEEQRKQYEKVPAWRGDISMLGSEVRLHNVDYGELKVWKEPAEVPKSRGIARRKWKNRYIVVVDVGGRSEKADYSVITVMDRWATRIGGKLEVVARWRGHLRYDRMAWKAVAIAEWYGHAHIVFESNTFDKKKAEANEYVEQGDHIRGILNVIGDKYDNLYMRPATDEEDIRNGVLSKVGFQTNKKTKQDIVDAFQVAFEEGNMIDPDEVFYKEAGIYEQRTDGSYGNIAGKDNHDDVVMTDMIGWYVHERMEKPCVEVEIEEDAGSGNEAEIVTEAVI